MGTAAADATLPATRRLRVFATDPSAGRRLETVELNELVLKIGWESNPAALELSRGRGDGPRMIGPVGEYVEVVDFDPASGVFYEPVDLNDVAVLAESGLRPSQEDPRFHQQMVYAVAMKTIEHFENALGRVALWAPRVVGNDRREFVRRLRIYPHALREANAYYSPGKKALLFGYFPVASPTDCGTVFTCLSSDIIAHETTHALLDGLHPRFAESTNPDVLALHEGFADLVALFQHFSNPEVLRHQLARTRGDLESQNSLGQLAQQFGRAVGRRGALRDALGHTDRETGEWKRREPNASALLRTREPHHRGAILVAAVFDAFLAIYRTRVADLLRIATSGSGVLPAGQLHPDLVQRLSEEAAKSASHVLRMCIRALDYCPPVDGTFGDYLRAVVTADYDLFPEDPHHYRVAFVEAFRAWGILPHDVRSLGLESVRHPVLRRVEMSSSGLFERLAVDWDLTADREEVWQDMRRNGAKLNRWLTDLKGGRELAPHLGLTLDPEAPRSVTRGRKETEPAVEVHSVRTAMRSDERGALSTLVVVEITQSRLAWIDPANQADYDAGKPAPDADFMFRRGCTLLIEFLRGEGRRAERESLRVRHVIRTRGDVGDEEALNRVREFLRAGEEAPGTAFYGGPGVDDPDGESFMALHRGLGFEED